MYKQKVQVKLGNNFMCLYSDPQSQSATKWVETLRPKLGFFHFTDFKRGKYSFSSPIPSMQCCATVWATYRTQQTLQLWMDGTERGGGGDGLDSFVPWSYPIWEQWLNNFAADFSWVCIICKACEPCESTSKPCESA